MNISDVIIFLARVVQIRLSKMPSITRASHAANNARQLLLFCDMYVGLRLSKQTKKQNNKFLT